MDKYKINCNGSLSHTPHAKKGQAHLLVLSFGLNNLNFYEYIANKLFSFTKIEEYS